VEKLAYKWLPLIAIAFVDFKRVVVKDHNVAHFRAIHFVYAEQEQIPAGFKVR
jgi:hypothetical protein